MSIIDTLRSVRIGPFAIFDFAMSFLGAYLIAPYLKIDRRAALLLIVPIGVLVHELVGRRTVLNKLVFESECHTARLVVAGLTIVGLYLINKNKTE